MQTLISVLLRSAAAGSFRDLPLSKEFVRGCISILVGLAVWEILTRVFLENELLIPPPSSVLRTIWKLASTGALNEHFGTTFLEFAYGFSVACVVGVILGYLMGMYSWFDEIVDPWIATLYSDAGHRLRAADHHLVRHRYALEGHRRFQTYRRSPSRSTLRRE